MDERALALLARTVLQPGFEGTRAPDWVRRRLGEGLGSVLLFARNIEGDEQTAALTAELRSENPDVIVAADEEGGDVTRLDAATGSAYPGNLALGAVDDPRLTEDVARALGRRLARAGIGLDYAPDADVNSNPDNPVIGVRSFGGDTALVARHTAAWVRGLQSAGVGACAKHFPGHGDTSVDSHVALPTVDLPVERLIETTLPPFRAAMDAGARAIMLGHLLLPAIDPDAPASVSRRVVSRLIHDELDFSGLIITDAMEMRAVSDRYGLDRAIVMSIVAGADLVCIGHTGSDELYARLEASLVRAVISGALSEARLAEAAHKVRAFVSWSHASADDGRPIGADIGLEAARRALSVTTRGADVLPLRTPPHVVTFTGHGPAALGSIAETSLGAELAGVLPGTTGDVLGECTEAALDAVLAAADGRPLVLVVRSAHRHPWMREALARLLHARPDGIVAEMGLPGPRPPAAGYLVGYGASRVCAQAAAEALVRS